MAATTGTTTSAGVGTSSSIMKGSWTTDSTKGDHVETVPRDIAFLIAVLDSGGTNPNILIKFADETDETILITGSTGAVTSPADSAGVTITDATGTAAATFDVDSTSQVNSGTNQWLAICKP